MPLNKDIHGNLKNILYIIFDVDCTLTMGEVSYINGKKESGKFNIRDGVGITLAQRAGIKCIFLTKSECEQIKQRADDLEIYKLAMNVSDKKFWIENLKLEHALGFDNFAFIGDDLNDYAAMSTVGFCACPNDAAPEIKAIAHYVASKNGGCGAVREILQFILCVRGEWGKLLSDKFDIEY